jgi:hypothetical protein
MAESKQSACETASSMQFVNESKFVIDNFDNLDGKKKVKKNIIFSFFWRSVLPKS